MLSGVRRGSALLRSASIISQASAKARRHAVLKTPFQPTQKRWDHSVAEKYRARLAEHAQTQGLSVEELIAQAREQASKRKDPLGAKAELAAHQAANPPRSRSKPTAAQLTRDEAPTKELNDYVDVEKLQPHSAKEIEMIWKARFVNSSTEFCGSMLAEPFSRLYVTARRFPNFVLPLPRGSEGVELHYVQWSFVSSHTVYCLITSLGEYKLHGEYAHPHTTVMMHTDLVGDKGVVLVNTALMNNEIPLDLAVLLNLNLQRFYTASAASEHGAEKLDLLQEFNTGNPAFSVDRLIAAAETID